MKDESKGLLRRGIYNDGDFRAWNAIEIVARRGLAFDVEIHAEIEGGSYEVTEVRCIRREGGPEVTSEMLRAVPVGRILRAGALRANKVLRPTTAPRNFKAQGPTAENLRMAATIYRMAHLVRDNPTSAVSAGLGLPHSTAARWVGQARRAGFLGPAESRKAGEKRTTKGRD